MKWNLENIYNFEETDVLLKNLHNKIEKFKKYRYILDKNLSSEKFRGILKEKEEIIHIMQLLGGYSHLSLMEDTTNAQKLSYEVKLSDLFTDLTNELLFFDLWFKYIPEKYAKKFIESSGKYSYYLHKVRMLKDYTLKEDIEKIISLKSLTGSETLERLYDIITNKFVFDFKGKKLVQEELVSYVRSSKSEVRRKAYTILLSRYKDNKEVLGELYKGIVRDWNIEYVKIRKFKSSISPRNLQNDVSDTIIKTLLQVIRENIHIFHEYFKLKAKLLGVKKLSRFDIYAPIIKVDKKFEFEDSKKLVLEVYKDFSDEAYNLAKEIFDLNQVHAFPKKGKQSGAFCSTITNNIRPFILLNHNNKLNDVFTMMHEFGHGIHGSIARNQTKFTYHSSLPMAETASTFGETLLMKKLLMDSNSKEKISLLMKSLESHYASIIRQAYFVIFEEEAHKIITNGASVDEIENLYFLNLKEQFGDSIKINNLFKYEWTYIPHIYHTPFYCYAYSFGNLLALSLFKIYEREKQKFVKNYLNILAEGGNDSPANIISKHLGLNISKPEFWQNGFDLIKEELKELKTLIEKNSNSKNTS